MEWLNSCWNIKINTFKISETYKKESNIYISVTVPVFAMLLIYAIKIEKWHWDRYFLDILSSYHHRIKYKTTRRLIQNSTLTVKLHNLISWEDEQVFVQHPMPNEVCEPKLFLSNGRKEIISLLRPMTD